MQKCIKWYDNTSDTMKNKKKHMHTQKNQADSKKMQ